MTTRVANRVIATAALVAAVVACAPAAQAQRLSLAERVDRLEQQAQPGQPGGAVDLVNQISSLQSQVQMLQGKVEELQHALDQATQRSRDQYVDLDSRLGRIEGATEGLAETRSELAALGDQQAGIESRLDATVPMLSHVAVLIDKYARPMVVADLDVADGRLVLRLKIRPPRDFAGKTLEVWLVPPQGTPRSLGLFPSEKAGTTVALNLPHDIAEALATSQLAVSLEPSGGSATGAPTGPVLFSGAVLPVDL